MFIFICHMDTVVVGEGWTKNPFGAEIEEHEWNFTNVMAEEAAI